MNRYVINPVKCDCGEVIYHDKAGDDDSVVCPKCGVEYVVTV
nr:hypothetical protein [Methanobrevibacter arboriphilus]